MPFRSANRDSAGCAVGSQERLVGRNSLRGQFGWKAPLSRGKVETSRAAAVLNGSCRSNACRLVPLSRNRQEIKKKIKNYSLLSSPK